eukprot:CAMPEP_0173437632 /NCGR_PEP_ID=MMETSP1357-20121228/18132_1 /TAXON_ID=77926 /ORGANISM="Hemiselmis rufescens, Strain PCC563" /LENGTH=64 /DNA_ID=CAMNT_0014402825 /DNA_START=40 /DNA_END=231 /DNA_ORIENTATION=-
MPPRSHQTPDKNEKFPWQNSPRPPARRTPAAPSPSEMGRQSPQLEAIDRRRQSSPPRPPAARRR